MLVHEGGELLELRGGDVFCEEGHAVLEGPELALLLSHKLIEIGRAEAIGLTQGPRVPVEIAGYFA